MLRDYVIVRGGEQLRGCRNQCHAGIRASHSLPGHKERHRACLQITRHEQVDLGGTDVEQGGRVVINVNAHIAQFVGQCRHVWILRKARRVIREIGAEDRDKRIRRERTGREICAIQNAVGGVGRRRSAGQTPCQGRQHQTCAEHESPL
jgi:hypothetical protein